MTPQAENKDSPLNVLRQLFDDVRMSNLKHGKGWAGANSVLPWAKTRRAAIKAGWAKAQAERGAKVACCPKCREWFPSVIVRNAHRNVEHGPQASVAGKAA